MNILLAYIDPDVIWMWVAMAAFVIVPIVLINFQKPKEKYMLFDRESMRQIKRLELNRKRELEGKPTLPSPEIIQGMIFAALGESESANGCDQYSRDDRINPEEARRILKQLDLWPEAPPGKGGIWYNDPVYRVRKPIPGRAGDTIVGRKNWEYENYKWLMEDR